MGLDMYLKGQRYLSSFDDQDKEKAAQIQRMFPELEGRQGAYGPGPCIQEIEINVGYWRKANAIHKWFVDNIQGGEDDCKDYSVDREALRVLRDTCQRVLDFRHLANELLPTASGFFFGGTDYDEWYYRDIEHTIKTIDSALALSEDWDLVYQSSW